MMPSVRPHPWNTLLYGGCGFPLAYIRRQYIRFRVSCSRREGAGEIRVAVLVVVAMVPVVAVAARHLQPGVDVFELHPAPNVE